MTPFPLVGFTPLQTNRLFLRAPDQRDLSRFTLMESGWQNVPGLNPPVEWHQQPLIRTLNQQAEMEINRYWQFWVLSPLENGEMIGAISLGNLDRNRKQAEVVYEMMPAYRRRGLMQEALSAVIRFSFDTARLQQLIAYCEPTNTASGLLLKKLGFIQDEQYAQVKREDAKGNSIYVLHWQPDQTIPVPPQGYI